eukprot:TRINITY_DN955_c1_g1_i1.p1 TRINITY_DN955_c1_g1~~TRINITY_DN955_c1_g1_i1.p1  ORF type:complete len:379 (+),score=57.68 TRINITY_DN955_c1_g1_i1:111-1247(+)
MRPLTRFVKDVTEAMERDQGLKPKSLELSLAGSVLSPTSTLVSHGIEANSELTSSWTYNGYTYIITTCENDGDNYATTYFNNLSLEEAREYAVHLKAFSDAECANKGAHDDLLEEKVPNYNRRIIRKIIGTWLWGEYWRDLKKIKLIHVPRAAAPKVFAWKNFVVPVPGLKARASRYRLKEDLEEGELLEDVPMDGYRLTVETWECDGDNTKTETFDNLSLETIRKYATVLAYCKGFGNVEYSRDFEDEAKIINKISKALKTECDTEKLMYSLFGMWEGGEQNCWRVLDSVKIENLQNKDLIKKIDYKNFEKTAYDLAVGNQKSDTEECSTTTGKIKRKAEERVAEKRQRCKGCGRTRKDIVSHQQKCSIYQMLMSLD